MIYYTVYKTTNKLNSKFYIGAHKTENLEDNYLGSGDLLYKAIQKHGPDVFYKEVLYFLSSEEEMFNKEKETIKEFIGNSLCYNLSEGGRGGSTLLFSEVREKHSNSLRSAWENNNSRRGEHSSRMRLMATNNPYWKGKHRSKEQNSQHSNFMKGNKIGLGNKNWVLACHNRWHKGSIYECEKCLTNPKAKKFFENQEYSSNVT